MRPFQNAFKFVLLTLFPMTLNAGLFKLTNEMCTGLLATPGQCAAAKAAIEDEINKKLPSADTQDEYFKGMSNANAISAAGITTSYGTVFKHFLVGVTATAAADIGQKSYTDISGLTKNPEQYRGFGVQLAAIIGANIGNVFHMHEGEYFNPKLLDVYLSGFALNKTFSKIDAKYFGVGAGAQYKIFAPKNLGSRLVRWTGLDLGAGLLYTKLNLNASVDLAGNYPVDYAGTTYNVNVPAQTAAPFVARVKTFTVPLEASTGIRFLYFLKFVAGLGVDLNFGKTEGEGTLVNPSGQPVTGSGTGGTISATPNFNIDGSQGPSLVTARIFAGPHLEFGVGSIFINVQKGIFQRTLAVNSGLNFFW